MGECLRMEHPLCAYVPTPKPSAPAKAGDPVSRSVGDRARSRGVTGSPLEPVIGLAEGETRLAGGHNLPARRYAASHLLLYILMLEKAMPFGAFADIAEIEFILGRGIPDRRRRRRRRRNRWLR